MTDGDEVARKAVEEVAKKLQCRCISRSAGNPSPLTGEQLVGEIKKTPYDPVLVMFDDNGQEDMGYGEQAMETVISHPDIFVIGAIAVASNTPYVDGARVDFSITNDGKIISQGVNKDGQEEIGIIPRVYGDTVDTLSRYSIPLVIGIGDIGKMEGKDDFRKGAPITKKAIQLILEKSGYIEKRKQGHPKKVGRQQKNFKGSIRS